MNKPNKFNFIEIDYKYKADVTYVCKEVKKVSTRIVGLDCSKDSNEAYNRDLYTPNVNIVYERYNKTFSTYKI